MVEMLASGAMVILSLMATSCVCGFFPPPSEGDVRHLYPLSSVSVLLSSHTHALPYLLGWAENLQYPKQRLHFDIYLTKAANEDATKEIVQWWKGHFSTLFKSLTVHEMAKLDGISWQEHALKNARQRQSSFLLLWHGDDLPSNGQFIAHIFKKTRPVLASLLLPSPSERGRPNLEVVDSEQRLIFESSEVSYPLALNLDLPDSSYLTFEGGNVRGYEGEASPLAVLTYSASVMSIPLLVDRSIHFGWHFDNHFAHKDTIMRLRYHIGNLIADGVQLPQSNRVRAPVPEKKNFGFEKILIINLRRRPERRRTMQAICDVIGIECEFVDATDGRSLPTKYKVTQLDSFRDPSTKRKMTKGEVGCFLSHYRFGRAECLKTLLKEPRQLFVRLQ